jgi:hypothetical protein
MYTFRAIIVNAARKNMCRKSAGKLAEYPVLIGFRCAENRHAYIQVLSHEICPRAHTDTYAIKYALFIHESDLTRNQYFQYFQLH